MTKVAMALVYFWVTLNTQLVIPCLIYCRCQCTDPNRLFTISSLPVHHHRPHPRTLIWVCVCYVVQFAVVMDSIPQPQDRLVVIPHGLSKGSTATRRLHCPFIPGLPCHPPPRLAHSLEPPLKVLIVIAVDDGVDAGVGESQPVGEGEDVAGKQVELISVQACVVRHHHECPEGQPGQYEKQSHHDKHLYHPDLFLRYRWWTTSSTTNRTCGVVQRRLSVCNHWGWKFDADARVHHCDDREGHQVDEH